MIYKKRKYKNMRDTKSFYLLLCVGNVQCNVMSMALQIYDRIEKQLVHKVNIDVNLE